MSFKQTLKLAKAHNISVIELMVADEVAWIFGKKHPRYESICSIVYTMYMKTEGLTVNSLANSLRDLLDKREVKLRNVLGYESDYDTVVENACYMYC